MKLVGLMLCHHDDWIIGLSARAALKWCDALAVLDLGVQGRVPEIIDKLSGEEAGRVWKVNNSNLVTLGVVSPYQLLMDKANELGATHIAIIGTNYVLTSNVIDQIRSMIETLKEEQFLDMPLLTCWKGFMQYRVDKASWAGATIPIAFKNSGGIQWPVEAGYDHFYLPSGKSWTLHKPFHQMHGGMMYLEPVNWRLYKARYYLRQMLKLVKKNVLGGRPKLDKSASRVIDEQGIKLAKVPGTWWEGYFDLFDHVSMWKMPWYEEEISRLREENNPNLFDAIELPGEVIDAPVDLSRELELARNAERPAPRTPPKPKAGDKALINEEPASKAVKSNSLFWSGHFYDYSGYGKANREFLFRASNTLHVSLYGSELNAEPILVDSLLKGKVDVYRSIHIRSNAPLLRFFGPRVEKHPGYKVCFTMMETYGVHQSMVNLLNGYNEVWVPTKWNKQVFEDGGVKVPIRTMPLGVNTQLYSPQPKRIMKPLRLLTTDNAGEHEVPKGFLFINVSNPSFRKGLDVTIKAFEDAFHDDPEAALVLCVSYSSLVHCNPFELIKGGKAACKSRIYVLEGGMSEDEVAETYRSCDAYVTASRGEGWNLPLMEAAACGLPVIAPNAFSHHEFLTEENSFLFSPDGLKQIPESNKISEWYKDQLFAHYDTPSITELTRLLKLVKSDKALREKKADIFGMDISMKYSWEEVAHQFVSRIIEINDM